MTAKPKFSSYDGSTKTSASRSRSILSCPCTNNVGIYHEVTEYGAGLVTSCESDEIAHALSTLLDNESLRRKMGKSGRRLVGDKFTWEKVAARLIEHYETILSQGKVSP